MKLLMENWRKFINEMEDVGKTTEATPEEQESKTEEVLENIETNEDEVLKFFKDNPEIAEKIVKVAEGENTELNEEEKPSNTEMVSSLATFAGAATTLMGTLGIISGGSYFDDTTLAQMIVGGLGVAGVSKIVNALAKVAKKSKSEDVEEED